MNRLREILYIGFGGFFGAVSRFYVSGIAYRLFGDGFPYGTLTVNAIGSFLLGFISFLAVHRQLFGQNLRVAVTIGFLGAFTTFSTFSFETFNLLKEGSYYLSIMNILTNLAICLFMVFLGVSFGVLLDRIF